MPKHIEDQWLFLRPVMDKVATKQEIDTHYDIVEVLDINEALDLKAHMEHMAMKNAQRGKK